MRLSYATSTTTMKTNFNVFLYLWRYQTLGNIYRSKSFRLQCDFSVNTS